MDMDRIKRNVAKMVQQNAPEADVDAYIESEGATLDAVRAHRPANANPESPQVPMLESAGRGALQGATFGFSDEIWGGLKGGYDTLANGGNFTDNYAHVRDETRAANERAESANPGTYLAGEIGGGIALPMGTARTAAGIGLRSIKPAVERTFMQRVKHGATTGAGYGAAYGLGTSEGDALTQLGDTAKGAAFGAAVGGALPPVVDVGAALLKKITTPFRAALNPQKVGKEKFAEALMRDRTPSGVAAPGAIDATAARLDIARQTKPEMMLADLGGENTRNLMRSAANQQSTNAQRLNRTLDARQSNQWRRLERGMGKALGSPDEFAASIDQIVAERDKLSGPMFKAAMQVPIKPDPKLIEVMQRPGMQTIFKRVGDKLRDEGVDLDREPPMALFHRAKMEIDKAINEVKKGQANTVNWDVRTLTKMKHDLLDAIDNPPYKQALKVSAGENALKNAAEDGFDEALKLPTEDLAKKMRSFANDSEADMYRLGAARAIAGKIRQGNVNRDRTENLFSSPDIQLRMKAIFPNQGSLREFQRELVMEAKMSDTRKAVQGNSTTAKQLAQGQEAAQPVRWLQDTANIGTGRFAQPILAFLGRQAQKFSGITPGSANAILEAAMSKDGSAVASALRAAEDKALAAPGRRQGVADAIARGLVVGAPNDAQAGGLQGQTPYRRRFDEFGNPIF
jgi:hypothetical protein